jgi:hypothetical protein
MRYLEHDCGVGFVEFPIGDGGNWRGGKGSGKGETGQHGEILLLVLHFVAQEVGLLLSLVSPAKRQMAVAQIETILE